MRYFGRYLIFGFVTLFIFTSCSDKVLREMHKRENGEIVLSELYDTIGNVIQRNRYVAGQKYLSEAYIFVNDKIMHASFIYENITSSIQYFYVNHLLMKTVVSSEGQMQTVTEYAYNEALLVEQIQHHIVFSEQTEVTRIEYTPEGNRSVVMIFRDDILTETERMFYDEKEHLIRNIRIVQTDTVSLTTYTYNENKKISGVLRFSEGSETLKVNHLYDKSGRLSQTFYFDESDFIIREERRKYNSKGLGKALIIIDYRNFEGRGKKNVDRIRFRYSFY